MEILYTHQELDKDRFQLLLGRLFPGLTVFQWDVMNDAAPDGFDGEDPEHIFFHSNFDSEKIEFAQQITVYRTPEQNEEERSVFIAKQLSGEFGIAVLVPFTHPQEPRNPYYDLVFEGGITYLADDSNSNLVDGTSEKVRLIGAMNVAVHVFDAYGNLSA